MNYPTRKILFTTPWHVSENGFPSHTSDFPWEENGFPSDTSDFPWEENGFSRMKTRNSDAIYIGVPISSIVRGS